jgi:hypothetical protein
MMSSKKSITSISLNPYFCTIYDAHIIVNEKGNISAPLIGDTNSSVRLAELCLRTVCNLHRFKGAKGRLVIHTEFIPDDSNFVPDLT